LGAFGFASAEAAIGHDFLPDIISSDVHSLCVSGPAYDLLHTMSKLINCGIAMPDVVAMATKNPAQAMGRADLGHLSAGSVADISLIGVRQTTFEFVDTLGKTKTGNCMLQAHGLFLGGKFLEAAARPWE
jgi:dihydroorotase